mgnify:CR=1 FL=1
MGKIIAAERQKEIFKLLHDNGSVKIGQLADYFEVSRETIRRDLSYLTEIGAAQRSHGGATSIYEFGNIPIETRINKDADIKTKLCEKASRIYSSNWSDLSGFWKHDRSYGTTSCAESWMYDCYFITKCSECFIKQR